MNRKLEKGKNRVHNPDKEQGMVHKRVLDTVMDMVPGTGTGMDKEHKLDRVPGQKKVLELTPASGPMKCSPLPAGCIVECCLTNNW